MIRFVSRFRSLLHGGDDRLLASAAADQVVRLREHSPAAPLMADVLRSHRVLAALLFPGKTVKRVFPSDTGSARNSQSLQKAFATACAVAGLDVHVTPQVLRRTFNTLMVQAGVDRIVLRSQMGHCSEAMTERYSGVSVSTKRAAVEKALGPTVGV